MKIKNLIYTATVCLVASFQSVAQFGSIGPGPQSCSDDPCSVTCLTIDRPMYCDSGFIGAKSEALSKPQGTVLFTESDKLGEIQIIEDKSNDSSRIHTSFKSNITGDHFNSILIIDNNENISNFEQNSIKQDVSYTLILNFKNARLY